LSTAESDSIDTASLQLAKRSWQRQQKGQFSPGPRSYQWLLNDPLVRDWIDGYTSHETREKKLYQIEKVLRAGRLSGPSELLSLQDRDVKILVRRVVNWYLQQGKGVWARQITITLKGFLEAHDRRLEFKRSERIRTPPKKKVAIEHVPTKDEVFNLAENAGSARDTAIILCLFQSGVRVGCLCNWTYGLVAGQLGEKMKPPLRIKVTPNMDTKLSLYGLSYYVTGLRKEATQALQVYLETRVRRGWIPHPSDPLFVIDKPDGGTEKIRRSAIWRMVKASARRSGMNPESIWVHCLRKSFRKVLNATSHIDEDTKEALMGHKLPGSRGSYFDYHDEDEVMNKYSQADFSKTAPFVYDLPQ